MSDILDRLENINTREAAVQWAADAVQEIRRLRGSLCQWRPIAGSVLPRTGQILVTDADAADGSGQYGDLGLLNMPVTDDGRAMNQLSANYTRLSEWTYWMPAPPTPR
jgi:hypothetical protein